MAGLSENETFRFIELVRSYPCIWDCSNPEYIDRSIARECYISIARSMGNGMTEHDARKKMKSLRTQYTMNLKNMATAQFFGNYKNKRNTVWKFFKPLEFLRPHVGIREVTAKVQCDLPSKLQGTEIVSSCADLPSQNINSNSVDSSLSNVKIEDTCDQDILDGEEGNSDAGTFHGESDGSFSASVSVDGEGTDREDVEEEVEGSVHTLGQQIRKRHFQARHTCCEQRRPGESGVGVQRNLSGSEKKRKGTCTESAADVVVGVARKLLKKEPGPLALSENDHFFRMVALEVSRLPSKVQDSFRYRVHGLLLEEKEKLQE
ncbi:hypothetical protein ACOMHN_046650 [Nucella lapillus]